MSRWADVMSATIGSAPGSCGDRLPPPSFTGPTDYVGPLSLPGGRRMVWWTGRVAIGLLHEPHRPTQTSGGDWLQALLLRDVSAAAQRSP